MKDTYITYILLIVAVLAITYVVSLKTKEGMENRKNLVFVNEEGAYDLGNYGRPLQFFSKKPSDGSYGTPGSGTSVAARPVLPGQSVQVSTGKPDNSGVLSVPLIADPTESLQDVINKGVLAGLQQGAKDKYSNLTPQTDTATAQAPAATAPVPTPAEAAPAPAAPEPAAPAPEPAAPAPAAPAAPAPIDTSASDAAEEARQLEADIQEQQDKNEDLVEKLSGYKREVDLKKESRDNTFIEDYGKIEAKKNEIVNKINTINTLWDDIEETIEGNLEVSELPDNYKNLKTQVESLKQLKTNAETIFNDTVSLKTEYDTNNNSGGEPNSTLGSIENFETLNELKAIVNANQEIVTAYDNWKTGFLSQDSQLDRMNTEIDSKLDEINELKVPQDLKENLKTLKTNVSEKIAEKAELTPEQINGLVSVQEFYQDQLDELVKNVNTKASEVNVSTRFRLTTSCTKIQIDLLDITKLQNVINKYDSLNEDIETYASNYNTFLKAKQTFDSEIKRIQKNYAEQIKTFELPKASTDPYTIKPPEIEKPLPTAFTIFDACKVNSISKRIKDEINTYLNNKKKGINSTKSSAEQKLAMSNITLDDIVIALKNINPKITFLEKINSGNLPLDEDNNITIQLSYLKEKIDYTINTSEFNYEQLIEDLSGVQTELEAKQTAILDKQEQERIRNTPIFQNEFYNSPGGFVGPKAKLGELNKTPIECNTTGAPEGVEGKTSLLQSYGFYGFQNEDGTVPGTNKYKYKTKCAINVGQTQDPIERSADETFQADLQKIISGPSFDGPATYLNCNWEDDNGIKQKGIISEIFMVDAPPDSKGKPRKRMKYTCVFPEENVYSQKSGRWPDDEITIDKDYRYTNVRSLNKENGGDGFVRNLGSGKYSPACPDKTYLSYTGIYNTNPNRPFSIQYKYKCMGRRKDLNADPDTKGSYGGNLNAAAEAEAAARKERAMVAGCNDYEWDPWKNGGKCQWDGVTPGKKYDLSPGKEGCYSRYGPKLGELFRCFEYNNHNVCGWGSSKFAGVGGSTKITSNTQCLKDRGIDGSVWRGHMANFWAVTEDEYNKLKRGNH